MTEINIQADTTAGIFRVEVDGSQVPADRISVEAKPDREATLTLHWGKSERRFVAREIFINTREAKEEKHATKGSGRKRKR